MSGFTKVKLETIAEVIDSLHQTPSYSETGLPMVRVTDIKRGYLDLSNTLKVSPDVFAKFSKNHTPKKGDILFSRVGSYGNTCIVNNETKFCLGQNTAFIIPKENPLFLYYYLNSPDGQFEIESSVAGSTQPTVSLKSIKNFEVPSASAEEQKAIASVLSSLDDKIDLLHQNTTLESMAETLFRQWFVEEAQEDWEEISFGEFVTPKKGKNITKAEAIEGIYPVIAGGLTPSCFHNKANTNSPFITISASGANAGFICLHHSPVWSSDSSYIDNTISEYVYFCYVFLKYSQSILTDKQEGSAQPHIYPSHIMDLITLNYPIGLIKSFENQVKNSFEKIKLNQNQIQTLEKTAR